MPDVPAVAVRPPATARRFALAWAMPLAVAFGAWRWPLLAGLQAVGVIGLLAVLERVPAWRHGWPPMPGPSASHAWVLRIHAGLQAGLLAGVVAMLPQAVAQAGGGTAAALALATSLGIAVGTVTGSQGITFAHELGHSRRRGDRRLAWLLMGSVLYAHFMVEHYRGHHPRAATDADPASARRGESLWRFLPRTLAGGWRSAWALERQRLAQRRRGWRRSPLAWACFAQAALLMLVTAAGGWAALVFWLAQAATAVWLLETVNYIEHYGLRRGLRDGRPVPFAVGHAWNADAAVTNLMLANLQRHSDHHLHAWKPYETLQPSSGPQLPTGYAGCLWLAVRPSAWFAAMHPRLDALAAGTVRGGGTATP